MEHKLSLLQYCPDVMPSPSELHLTITGKLFHKKLLRNIWQHLSVTPESWFE